MYEMNGGEPYRLHISYVMLTPCNTERGETENDFILPIALIHVFERRPHDSAYR